MLNTQTKLASTNKLHLYPLDFAAIRQDSFDKVKQFLIDYQKTHPKMPLLSAQIGLDHNFQITIVDSHDTDKMCDELFAIKMPRANYQENRTLDEWTWAIIDNYLHWLKRQYKYQSKITMTQLQKLMLNTQARIFSREEYIKYLFANLDTLVGDMLRPTFGYEKLIKHDIDYVVNYAISYLQTATNIRSSIVNALTECANYHRDYPNGQLLADLLYKIATSQSKVKLITDNEPVNYPYLVRILPTNQPIRLPFTAITNILDSNYDASDFSKVVYYLASEQDLQLYINDLLFSTDNPLLKYKTSVDDMEQCLAETKQSPFELTSDMLNLIKQKIALIRHDFAYTKRLLDVADILETICKHAKRV